MFTGDIPFSGHSSTEVIVLVLGRERPRRPTHPVFTEDLWSLMQCCWDHNHNSRPTASKVLGSLEVVTRGHSGYCYVKIDPCSVSDSTVRDLGMCSNLPANTGLTFERECLESRLSFPLLSRVTKNLPSMPNLTREAVHRSNTESGGGGAGVPTVLGVGRRIRGEDKNTGTHPFLP